MASGERAVGQETEEGRRKGAEHQIEDVGARLRSMMAWIGASKIVDKSKN